MSGYYSDHSKEYIASTIGIDMSATYALFEPLLEGKRILDVGFGSARDMLHFQSKGYEVVGIDTEPSFIDHAKSLGLMAYQGDARNFRDDRGFDGIWAVASLLHLPKKEMISAIENLKGLLNPKGTIFLSLKEGDQEGLDEKGRIMTYVNKDFLESLGFEILSINSDSLKREIRWLNAFYKNDDK